ncbi:hypothetical protein E2C01_085282 [Portunus trituberculatus]|uniref:Uncharacterized protein n=1 Tax=Portunus trituberculatus TaxID=210409 RepID=A0A5B7J6F1_PORTR|nr:hypothetical protein [Portunus trituberculatus]
MSGLWEAASKGVAGAKDTASTLEAAAGRVSEGTAQVMAGGKSVMTSAVEGAEGVASSVTEGARLVGSAVDTAGSALQQTRGALGNLSLPVTAEAKPKSKPQ